jgi:hypothetical protein
MDIFEHVRKCEICRKYMSNDLKEILMDIDALRSGELKNLF